MSKRGIFFSSNSGLTNSGWIMWRRWRDRDLLINWILIFSFVMECAIYLYVLFISWWSTTRRDRNKAEGDGFEGGLRALPGFLAPIHFRHIFFRSDAINDLILCMYECRYVCICICTRTVWGPYFSIIRYRVNSGFCKLVDTFPVIYVEIVRI